MECADFRQIEATTPDRREDDPTGGDCVARWDGVRTLEIVGLVGEASAVVSDMVTPTAAVTSGQQQVRARTQVIEHAWGGKNCGVQVWLVSRPEHYAVLYFSLPISHEHQKSTNTKSNRIVIPHLIASDIVSAENIVIPSPCRLLTSTIDM